MKKVVVLGGGYAGVLTAKKLAKKFKKNKDVQITLIDKQSYHTMLTELHEVAAGRVNEESIRMDLKSIFAGRNVNVVLDEIKNIEKTVSDSLISMEEQKSKILSFRKENIYNFGDSGKCAAIILRNLLSL